MPPAACQAGQAAGGGCELAQGTGGVSQGHSGHDRRHPGGDGGQGVEHGPLGLQRQGDASADDTDGAELDGLTGTLSGDRATQAGHLSQDEAVSSS